jgi:hypothetical protein
MEGEMRHPFPFRECLEREKERHWRKGKEEWKRGEKQYRKKKQKKHTHIQQTCLCED